MDAEERKRVGARIMQARKEAGLTQRELGDLLGITTRSVQNYESGSIVPWRHLTKIEVLTRKRAGWLLRGEGDGGGLEEALTDMLRTMKRHHELLRDHMEALRVNTARLREQQRARRRRDGALDEADD